MTRHVPTRSLAQICRAAGLEGWSIFSAGLSSQTPGALAYQIERDDAQQIFESDHHAWAHVIARALSGETLHRDALAFLREHGPDEYARILQSCSAHQRLLLASHGL